MVPGFWGRDSMIPNMSRELCSSGWSHMISRLLIAQSFSFVSILRRCKMSLVWHSIDQVQTRLRRFMMKEILCFLMNSPRFEFCIASSHTGIHLTIKHDVLHHDLDLYSRVTSTPNDFDVLLLLKLRASNSPASKQESICLINGITATVLPPSMDR